MACLDQLYQKRSGSVLVSQFTLEGPHAIEEDIQPKCIRSGQRADRESQAFHGASVYVGGGSLRSFEHEKRFIDHREIKPVDDETRSVLNGDGFFAAPFEKSDHGAVSLI
jgi:hypothetical protein